MVSVAEALGADSAGAGLFVKLRGRAAKAQRSVASGYERQ